MRQSAEQIDNAILDAAAGIFATHGFAQTSVQQVADAVGYSKAGLLHRFGSKEALFRAVVASGTGRVEQVIASAGDLGDSADPVRDLLTLMAEEALDRPGMVQLMLRSFDPLAEEPNAEEIQALGYRLVDLLDQERNAPADRLRVVLALQLLVNAALIQGSTVDMDLHVDRAELVPLVVDLAAHVLGHRA